MKWQHLIICSAVIPALLISCTPAATQPKVTDVTPLAPPVTSPPVILPQEESRVNTVAVPVPDEYKQLYSSLSDKLDTFDRGLTNCSPTGQKFIYAAELLAANCNAGEKLLNESYYQGVLVWLDAFEKMGINGVKIAIDYPFFTPGFPNNDAYVKFYKRIVQECRSRKFIVLIANGNLFPNSPFSDLKYSFSGLTLEKYRQGKKQSCETIIRELHPDYLTIANEPTTEKLNLDIEQSPIQFAGTTSYVLNGLEHSGTLMGSGTGTWSNMNYIRELVKIRDLDYIDMHIYPIDYLQGVVDAAEIARVANKRLVLAEIGLYKVRDSEMSDLGRMATQAIIYSRDIFSFWEPLDSKFLQVVVKMAKCNGYEFISPFWSTHLSSYIDYDYSTKNMTYNQLRQLDNNAAYTNAVAGKLSGWGETYRKIIASDPVEK